MKAIVAVDNNWGIGKNNGLLFDLKADMAFFKDKTLDKVVVMGSNTLLSFPNSKPLKRRVNVVLWPGAEPREDCVIVGSLEELSDKLTAYDSDDTFIIGGAMFYRTMLPYCDTVYVTKVEADGGATVFYENLDKLDNWYLAEQSEKIEDSGYVISFCTYKNKSPLKF